MLQPPTPISSPTKVSARIKLDLGQMIARSWVLHWASSTNFGGTTGGNERLVGIGLSGNLVDVSSVH